MLDDLITRKSLQELAGTITFQPPRIELDEYAVFLE